jgi:dTDP-4-dehydrorhamnose 3,5-epimerase-like enzyme
MLLRILTPSFTHSDERGTLVQLFPNGYKQVNVTFSKTNALRGGHYHRENTEAFYVISGHFSLVLSKDDEHEEHIFKAGDMFEILPNVLHEFSFSEDTLLVSMYDKGVEIPSTTEADNVTLDIYRNAE